MRIDLQRSVRLAFLVSVFFIWHRAVLAEEDPTGILTTAAEVRNLTVAQAERHYPVKLRAVVTFYDDALFSRFIQDGTGGDLSQ